MAVIYSGKLQGQTSAGAAVATQVVTLDSDGCLRWTDAAGRKHSLAISGKLGMLLETLFTGVGGITHKLFK